MAERTVLLRGIGRLVTSDERGTILDKAAIVMRAGRVAWLGREQEIDPHLAPDQEVDLGGALVTPGLIDAHTHPLYAGNRFAEIALRSKGASYAEIAQKGGGIASTVASTRATSYAALGEALADRLLSFLSSGTTTLEAKTGYHLERTGELAAVGLLAAESDGLSGAAVEVTYLGGHAVGPEWAGDPDGYAKEAASWSRQAREAGARHVDVFCDTGYFSVEQARAMLTAGMAAGLIPRIHADELALTGGAELAAEIGCASADHLLRIDEVGMVALRDGDVVATLAPVTALSMGRTPPARALLQHGVVLALGSDHNPGTCGTTSMSLVMALAISELGLSVEEAIAAATTGGARSLRLTDRGALSPGLRADIVAWQADHEGAFAWSYGLAPLGVWQKGERRI